MSVHGWDRMQCIRVHAILRAIEWSRHQCNVGLCQCMSFQTAKLQFAKTVSESGVIQIGRD